MGKNKTAAKKAAQEKAVETKKGETKAKVETKATEVKEKSTIKVDPKPAPTPAPAPKAEEKPAEEGGVQVVSPVEQSSAQLSAEVFQNEDLRIFHNRLGNAKSLAHAKRILAHGFLFIGVKPYHANHFVDAFLRRFAGNTGKDRKVAPSVIMRKKSRRFNDDPRRWSEVGVLADHLAVYRNRPAGRLREATDTPHQRCFAAAIRADKTIDCMILKGNADIMQNSLLTKLLTQMANNNHDDSSNSLFLIKESKIGVQSNSIENENQACIHGKITYQYCRKMA